MHCFILLQLFHCLAFLLAVSYNVFYYCKHERLMRVQQTTYLLTYLLAFPSIKSPALLVIIV